LVGVLFCPILNDLLCLVLSPHLSIYQNRLKRIKTLYLAFV
jgi:hypothetical protein